MHTVYVYNIVFIYSGRLLKKKCGNHRRRPGAEFGRTGKISHFQAKNFWWPF